MKECSGRQSDSPNAQPGKGENAGGLSLDAATRETLTRTADALVELGELLRGLAARVATSAERAEAIADLRDVATSPALIVSDDEVLRARDLSPVELAPLLVHYAIGVRSRLALCVGVRLRRPLSGDEAVSTEPARVTCRVCAELLETAGLRRRR